MGMVGICVFHLMRKNLSPCPQPPPLPYERRQEEEK